MNLEELRQSPALNNAQQNADLRHWAPLTRWYYPSLCSLVVRTSQWVMQTRNQVQWTGRAQWDALFATRAEKLARGERPQGVLTVSNHVSLFDDPLLISCLGERRFEAVRWIGADHINFFGSALKGAIYSAGKCVPIIRGAGLRQPGFDFLLERLRAGDWVHLFPEGGRSRREYGLLQTPLKLGVGCLIAEAQPLVVPFYHYGMHQVMPIGAAVPRHGQTVHVHFGDVYSTNEQWLDQQVQEWSSNPKKLNDTGEIPERWFAATRWVEHILSILEKECNPHAEEEILTKQSE